MISTKVDVFRVEGLIAAGMAGYKLVFGVLRPSTPGPTLLGSVFIIFGIYIIIVTSGWAKRLLAIVLVADITLKTFGVSSFSTDLARYTSLLFAAIYAAIALFYWGKGRNTRGGQAKDKRRRPESLSE